MIRNLSKALTIVARAEADEIIMHDDVDAWGAPGECHALVMRGEHVRLRRARRHAEAVAQRPWRVIRREAAKRGCAIGSRAWDALVARIYARNCPFR